MSSQKQSFRVSRKELEQLSPQERIQKFGYDPIIPDDEPYISMSTVIMALSILGLVIGGTIFALHIFVRPGTVPMIDTTAFELPVSEDVAEHQHFRDAVRYWTEQDHDRFISTADDLMLLPAVSEDIEVVKELNLYKIRSHILAENLDLANQFARTLQGRHQDDLVYLSDLYYYRGHIITKRDGLREAYGAFAESYALGGRYADESYRIMRQIERMNRPLW